MTNKTAFGAIATAAAASTLLFTAGPATAQTAEDFVPSCATAVLSYPLGSTDAPQLTDAAPAAGTIVTVTSGIGAFDPDTRVAVTFLGEEVGAAFADEDGFISVDVQLPASLAAGTYVVVLTGVLDDEARIVGVCVAVSEAIGGVDEEPGVVETPAPAPVVVTPVKPAKPVTGVVQAPAQRPVVSNRPAALPFTGSVELLTVVALGAGLVAAGAGTVVVARRRRQAGDLPA